MPVGLARRYDSIAKFDEILLLQLKELLPRSFCGRFGVVGDDDEVGHEEFLPEICSAVIARGGLDATQKVLRTSLYGHWPTTRDSPLERKGGHRDTGG